MVTIKSMRISLIIISALIVSALTEGAPLTMVTIKAMAIWSPFLLSLLKVFEQSVSELRRDSVHFVHAIPDYTSRIELTKSGDSVHFIHSVPPHDLARPALPNLYLAGASAPTMPYLQMPLFSEFTSWIRLPSQITRLTSKTRRPTRKTTRPT